MGKHPIPVASVVLLNERNELLMGRRADCGLWEIPGGKVDNNESMIEGGRRELREETGIEAIGGPNYLGYGEMTGVRPATYGQRFILHFFLWRTWNGEPVRVEPDKCLEFRWFPLDRLPPDNICTLGTVQFINNIVPTLR